ncbi:MAG: peptidylprolyl isomerase, partial [Alphaproteobacteria bacterium]
DFMIQGGGMTKDLQQKPTNPPVKNEADNGLKNTLGTVAMARTSAVDSATSQFFVNTKDNAFLDHRGKTPTGWGYTVFGKVVSGLDVVRKIEAVETGSGKGGLQDVPKTPVVIESVKLQK